MFSGTGKSTYFSSKSIREGLLTNYDNYFSLQCRGHENVRFD